MIRSYSFTLPGTGLCRPGGNFSKQHANINTHQMIKLKKWWITGCNFIVPLTRAILKKLLQYSWRGYNGTINNRTTYEQERLERMKTGMERLWLSLFNNFLLLIKKCCCFMSGIFSCKNPHNHVVENAKISFYIADFIL